LHDSRCGLEECVAGSATVSKAAKKGESISTRPRSRPDKENASDWSLVLVAVVAAPALVVVVLAAQAIANVAEIVAKGEVEAAAERKGLCG
jgi:hypothetical protein